MLRIAVAINNIAVSLVEKRCFSQAMVSFKDCLLILKMTATEGASASSLDLQGKLHAAMARLYQPAPCCSVAPLELETLSTTTLIYSLSETIAASPEPPPNQVHCIQMDHSDSDYENLDGPGFVSTIVLHNYAMACFCMGNFTASAATHDKLLKNALTLLLASHAVILSHIPAEDDAYTMTIQLETVVLRAMVATATPFMYTQRELCEKLLHLQNAIREMNGPDQIFCRLQTAPAA